MAGRQLVNQCLGAGIDLIEVVDDDDEFPTGGAFVERSAGELQQPQRIGHGSLRNDVGRGTEGNMTNGRGAEQHLDMTGRMGFGDASGEKRLADADVADERHSASLLHVDATVGMIDSRVSPPCAMRSMIAYEPRISAAQLCCWCHGDITRDLQPAHN